MWFECFSKRFECFNLSAKGRLLRNYSETNCSVVVFEFVEQKLELQIVIEAFFPMLTYSLQLLGLGRLLAYQE